MDILFRSLWLLVIWALSVMPWGIVWVKLLFGCLGVERFQVRTKVPEHKLDLCRNRFKNFTILHLKQSETVELFISQLVGGRSP